MPPAFKQIVDNLAALGLRRLATLAGVGLATLGLLTAVALFASRPDMEMLYSGLDRADINRIGARLAQGGIRFDVASDGSSVHVERGRGAEARMILAEAGLPRSGNAGYELFDSIGSLGLTSFMQRVTRLRALEGEIARSVRLVDGVRSARVHLVLPDRTRFAAQGGRASASVLVDADAMPAEAGRAIRHLVAAAVPDLAIDDVTVMGTQGHLLAAGADAGDTSTTGSFELQRLVERSVAENVSRVIGPWLGAAHHRVSVRAVIDTDRASTDETTFDPDSRVERSVQVRRREEQNSERAADAASTVTADIPEEAGETIAGASESRASESREETTNYEINSKRTRTERNGYRVTKLSASVVLDRTRLLQVLDGDEAKLDARIAEVEKAALAAGGFSVERGDALSVMALPFDKDDAVTDSAEPIGQVLARQAGSYVRALAVVAAVLAVLMLGVRPALRALAVHGAATDTEVAEALPPREPRERLAELVDRDEERALAVVRLWIEEAKSG